MDAFRKPRDLSGGFEVARKEDLIQRTRQAPVEETEEPIEFEERPETEEQPEADYPEPWPEEDDETLTFDESDATTIEQEAEDSSFTVDGSGGAGEEYNLVFTGEEYNPDDVTVISEDARDGLEEENVAVTPFPEIARVDNGLPDYDLVVRRDLFLEQEDDDDDDDEDGEI